MSRERSSEASDRLFQLQTLANFILDFRMLPSSPNASAAVTKRLRQLQDVAMGLEQGDASYWVVYTPEGVNSAITRIENYGNRFNLDLNLTESELIVTDQF